MDIDSAREIDLRLRSLVTANDVFSNIALDMRDTMISSSERRPLGNARTSQRFLSSVTLTRTEASLIEQLPDNTVVSFTVNNMFMEAMKLSTQLRLNVHMRFTKDGVSLFYEKPEQEMHFTAFIANTSFHIYQFRGVAEEVCVQIPSNAFKTTRSKQEVYVRICRERGVYTMYSQIGQATTTINADFNEISEPDDPSLENLLFSASVRSDEFDTLVSVSNDEGKLLLHKTNEMFVLQRTGGNQTQITFNANNEACRHFDTNRSLMSEISSSQRVNVSKFVKNTANAKSVLLELRELSLIITKSFNEVSYFKICVRHSQSNSQILPGNINEDIDSIIEAIDDDLF